MEDASTIVILVGIALFMYIAGVFIGKTSVDDVYHTRLCTILDGTDVRAYNQCLKRDRHDLLTSLSIRVKLYK